MEKFKFKHKGKKIEIDVKHVSIFSMGLMFKSKNTLPRIFKLNKLKDFKITSLFVFFPFVAVWFDEQNKILEIKKIKPFTLSVEPKKSFSKLLEIPINDKNKKIIKLLVDD